MFAQSLLPALSLLASVGAPSEPDETYRVDISISEEDCEDAYFEDLAELEPTPTGLVWDGTYFVMGIAPATTLHATGFHPNLRYDWELGMAWQRKRSSLTVGLDGHVMQYFNRKVPGGGADVVVTGGHGPVYARAGLGVATGIPRSELLDDFRPVVGGVVGIGLQGGKDEFLGRVGVDYDVRFDDEFGMTHTVLLVARFAWGI